MATLRHATLQSYLSGYQQLGASGLPVLVVWGRQDRAFPYTHHRALLERVPQAELVSVDHAGHLPQLERPEVVNPALQTFLNSLPRSRRTRPATIP